jgi:metal-responsive CopG/Arc/MetJ family transcriptional regulator
MTTQAQNVTVSIPRNLILLADEVAREQQISRSNFFATCLKEFAERRLQEQLEEGYKAMAKENKQFADVALSLAHEVLPEWE